MPSISILQNVNDIVKKSKGETGLYVFVMSFIVALSDLNNPCMMVVIFEYEISSIELSLHELFAMSFCSTYETGISHPSLQNSKSILENL